MEIDSGRSPEPHRLSPTSEPESIPTLDGWIENLMNCKQLAENDVQRLCDRVSIFLFILITPNTPGSFFSFLSSMFFFFFFNRLTLFWLLCVFNLIADVIRYRLERFYKTSQMCSLW